MTNEKSAECCPKCYSTEFHIQSSFSSHVQITADNIAICKECWHKDNYKEFQRWPPGFDPNVHRILISLGLRYNNKMTDDEIKAMHKQVRLALRGFLRSELQEQP